MPDDCANPLLVQWVREWYDKAKEQNSKGQFTYKKAYESIKACPLPLEHPSQASELKGLGPKLCDRLTEKLKDHCSENGLPMPEDPRNKSKKRPNDATAVAETDEAAPAPAKKARTKKPKLYVPTLRSGAYAIMLALSTLPDPSVDSHASMTKNQIVDIAQSHCDSSFSAPSDPGKTYTAWSSINTLMNKDLVCVGSGASKKYMLTDDGWDVARRVRGASGLEGGKTQGTGDQMEQRTLAADQSHVCLTTTTTFENSCHGPAHARVSEVTDVSGRAGHDTVQADKLPPRSHIGQPGCSAKLSKSKQMSKAAAAKTLQRNSEPPSDTRTAVRKVFKMPTIDDSALIGDPLHGLGSTASASHSQPADVIVLEDTESEADNVAELPGRRRGGRMPLQRSISASNRARPTISRSSSPSIGENVTHHPMAMAAPSKAPQKVVASGDAKGSLPVILPDVTPVHVPPGSFTIELLLDTREVRSRTDRTYLQDGLLAQGVRPDTRALELGDALWIARVHDPTVLAALGATPPAEGSTPSMNLPPTREATEHSLPGAPCNPRAEIVLPYVLERKRLDDLIASLKDGRYHEQKFRLRRSGLKNLTYLVEDVGLAVEVRQKWHEAVKSAIAATMVQDNFFVRRTKNLDESIRYMARLTKAIRAAYQATGLQVLPERALEQLEAPAKNRQDADRLLAAFQEKFDGRLLLTYPVFSQRSSKHAARTVRAVYLRMLMATRGVTAWKARAIQRKYPTPSALAQAYRDAAVQAGGSELAKKEQSVLLFKELGHWSVGKGSLGKAVSAKVAGVWAGIGDV